MLAKGEDRGQHSAGGNIVKSHALTAFPWERRGTVGARYRFVPRIRR
jgi:hypothetical protein